MNWYFISAWVFTILMCIGMELVSDILIIIFGLFIFISVIKGLCKEKKDKETREKWETTTKR
jgi:ABC-type nickel/cobalt efflux system permease component RcnA